MYYRITFLPLVLIAVSLSACSTTGSIKPLNPSDSPSQMRQVPNLPEVNVNQITQRSDSAQETNGALKLRDALSLSLMKNPLLASFSWEIKSRDAARLQAALLPNPELSFEIENFAGTDPLDGVSQAESTISIGQLIEVAGKRGKREHVAALNRDLSLWDYHTQRLRLFKEVSTRFITVLGDQQKVVLSEELLDLAKQLAEVVSKRVNAGKVSPVEEIKANVALASAKIDLDRAKRALLASRLVLATQWGSTQTLFSNVVGSLKIPDSLPPFDQLSDQLSQNPALARWTVELAQRSAIIDLERANAIPNITIGGGFRQFNESDATALVGGISMDLPMFDRNQGNIAKARAQHSKALAEQYATGLRLRAGLFEAYRSLSTTYAAVKGLQDELLPGATKTFEAVSEGYRLGKFDLLDVLDAQRTLADASAQVLQAQIDHHKSLADVEELIGAQLAQQKTNSKVTKEMFDGR